MKVDGLIIKQVNLACMVEEKCAFKSKYVGFLSQLKLSKQNNLHYIRSGHLQQFPFRKVTKESLDG